MERRMARGMLGRMARGLVRGVLTLSFVVVASDGHTDLLSGKKCDSFIETEQKLDKSYGETIVERKSQWKSKTNLEWTNLPAVLLSKISIVVCISQWFAQSHVSLFPLFQLRCHNFTH